MVIPGWSSKRRAAVVAVLVPLWPVTACSGSGTPSAGGTGDGPRPSVSGSPTGGTPEQGWQRNRACKGSTDFSTQAAAYRRNGLNLFVEDWFNGAYHGPATVTAYPREDDALTAQTLLPDGWRPGPREGYKSTAAALVLCHTATATGKRRIATCKFTVLGGAGPSTIPVVPATHHFEVYESRTGRFVTTFDVKGTTLVCPDRAHQVSSADVIAYGPSSSALAAKLRPLREGRF
ncbi:hypothetical protein [Spirillospora sp. CA-294931]|uniref:hypothetical protein n=1 Tax=Spirillospora sp. CA-294931 TaxID=3240042 RepID=UPI003D8E07E6